MEEKQARLVVLIDPHHKAAFEAACASRDVTASEMIRRLIADHLKQHGIAGNDVEDEGDETEASAS